MDHVFAALIIINVNCAMYISHQI